MARVKRDVIAVNTKLKLAKATTNSRVFRVVTSGGQTGQRPRDRDQRRRGSAHCGSPINAGTRQNGVHQQIDRWPPEKAYLSHGSTTDLVMAAFTCGVEKAKAKLAG